MKIFIILTSILACVCLYSFKKDAPPSVLKEMTKPTTVLPTCEKEKGIAKIICLAENFKSTLSAAQLATVELAYTVKDAQKWSNLPQHFAQPKRVGLNLGALNPTQLAAAKSLMAAVLVKDVPNEGYDELEANLFSDDYIARITGKNDIFSSGNFYIAFLGKLSATGLWALQFGGHHFAFENTYNNGKTIGTTPSFRGIEPMEMQTNGRTYTPLENERLAFKAILEVLSDDEKKAAKLTHTFTNLLLGPGQDGKFPITKQGLRIGNLSKRKQKAVIKAIKLYVDDLDVETSKKVMSQYLSELADTYLAYTGSNSVNQVADYVRLDGPNIWIEYSAQPTRELPNNTHGHTVWRDRKGDYGGNYK